MSEDRVTFRFERHERFTVDSTSYLRNLDQEGLRAECIAVHYQDPPRPGSVPGSTTHSLRFPTLIIAHYISQPREIADKVARILNAHWDDPEPEKPIPAQEQGDG